MITHGTYKRNKAEILDAFIDNLLRRKVAYSYCSRKDEMDKYLTDNEQILYREASSKRHRWSGSYDANNPEIDFVILALKVIADKLLESFPEYKEEYEKDVLTYLAREERDSDLAESQYKSYIGKDSYVIKMSIPEQNKEKEKLKALWCNKREISYCYESSLTTINQDQLKFPFSLYEDGTYCLISENDEMLYAEVTSTPIKAEAVFSVERGLVTTSKDNIQLMRFLIKEDALEKEITKNLEIHYKEDSEAYCFSGTKEDFFRENRDKILGEILKTNKIYSRVIIPKEHFKYLREDLIKFEGIIYNEETEENEEFEGYYCSNCKDGGCIHCSPNDYI